MKWRMIQYKQDWNQTRKDSEMEWHKYGKALVGFDGDRVVCEIGTPEDVPCEMFCVQMFRDCYVSVDAAKETAEKLYHDMQASDERPRTPDYMDLFVTMMEPVIAMYKVRRQQSSGEATASLMPEPKDKGF